MHAGKPLLSLLPLLLIACQTYEAPPRIATTSLQKAVYDQRSGPLEITFEAPVNTDSLEITLYSETTNIENDLCVGDPLPAGCDTPATVVFGPCKKRTDREFRLDDPELGRAYTCEGGEMIISNDAKKISVTVTARLAPFQRYLARISEGLRGEDGVRRNIPIDVNMQASGEFALAPTTFESGFFFGVFDVKKPVNAQFHFLFFLDVNQDTGEFRMFAADLDPNDETIDSDTNRIPGDWFTDPDPPTGVTLAANGQVSESSDGLALAVFPFLLKVVKPAVEALDTEVTGTFTTGTVEGGTPDERQVLSGSLFSPSVYLGAGEDRAALGAGEGRMQLFRLTAEESPPLEDLMPTGVSVSDIFPDLAGG